MKAQLQRQFKQYQGQAQQWWRKREPREQQLLAAMLVLSLIFIFWYGIWQPLHQATERAENRLAAQQETLRFVIESTQQVEQLRSSAPAQQQRATPITAAQLSGFISRTSTAHNLEVSRLQPQNEGLQVVFNEADFDSLLAFLAELNERQVEVEAIDIAEAGEPGMVRVRRLQVRVGES